MPTWIKHDEIDYATVADIGYSSVNGNATYPGWWSAYQDSMKVENHVLKFTPSNNGGYCIAYPTTAKDNPQLSQRITVRWKYENSGESFRIVFRNTNVTGRTSTLYWYINFSLNDWGAKGTVSPSHDEVTFGAAGYGAGFVVGNSYDIDAFVDGDTMSLTITNPDGTPFNFNGSTNVATRSLSANNSDSTDAGLCFITAFNSSQNWAITKMAYYDTNSGVVVPDLEATELVASNIGLTTATLSTTVTGGTTPYNFQWQRKVNGNGDSDPYGNTWANVTLPNQSSVNVTGLTNGTGYNYRVVVTDSTDPTKTATTGKIFNTLGVHVEFQYAFGAGGDTIITANGTGGVAPYTYLWTVPSGGGNLTNLTVLSSSLATNQLHLNMQDVEVRHAAVVAVTDAQGNAWQYNNQHPFFSFPAVPYLRHTATVLRPTAGTAVALPSGFKFYQFGESITGGGNPKSARVIGNTLQAVKGVGTVSADGTGEYGTAAAAYLSDPLKTQFLNYINNNQITDLGLRLGYNDFVVASQTMSDIASLVDLILASCTGVQRLYLMPHIFRNSYPDWGDGGESRLRELLTLMGNYVAAQNNPKLILGSRLIYDMTQADSGVYDPGELQFTHPSQEGYNAIGDWDANMVLSQFPSASNTAVTGVGANQTRQFVFPVGTKGPNALANQATTFSVAKQGGGAAYGTINATTGIYTAPSSLPAGSGNADVVTATTAGGASTTVVVQLAAGGTPPDTTAPTISSVVVAANGLTATITLSETCTGTGGFTFTVAGAVRAATVAGSGTSRTATFGSVVYQGQVVTYSYAGTGITDAGGNSPAAVSGVSATNNSTQAVPVDPAPGGMVYVSQMVRGPLTLTAVSEAIAAPDVCYVGEVFKVVFVLRDGAGEAVPVAANTQVKVSVSAGGVLLTDAANGAIEWGPGGFVSYTLQTADTAASGKKQITVSVGAVGAAQTWGPFVLNVKAR